MSAYADMAHESAQIQQGFSSLFYRTSACRVDIAPRVVQASIDFFKVFFLLRHVKLSGLRNQRPALSEACTISLEGSRIVREKTVLLV